MSKLINKAAKEARNNCKTVLNPTTFNYDAIPDLILFLDENESLLIKENKSEVSYKEAKILLTHLETEISKSEHAKADCLSWLNAICESARG